MTDRELLELAAKAAGMTVLPYDEPWPSGAKGWFYNEAGAAGLFYSAGPAPQRWNPLADDGDALRLVSKLGLEIDQNHPLDNDEWVMALKNGQMTGACEDVDGNRCASLRRAIVRAAAEIGKAMP
jgi:hypothetical protein